MGVRPPEFSSAGAFSELCGPQPGSYEESQATTCRAYEADLISLPPPMAQPVDASTLLSGAAKDQWENWQTQILRESGEQGVQDLPSIKVHCDAFVSDKKLYGDFAGQLLERHLVRLVPQRTATLGFFS